MNQEKIELKRIETKKEAKLLFIMQLNFVTYILLQYHLKLFYQFYHLFSYIDN